MGALLKKEDGRATLRRPFSGYGTKGVCIGSRGARRILVPMVSDDPGPRILALDAAFLAVVWTAAFASQAWLILVGLVVLAVIFWIQGALRFRRLRRFLRELFEGVIDTFKGRKPSRQTLVRVGVVLGVIAVLVILNQLQLAAPGEEGRGFSLELSGLQLGFSGVNTPGEWLATGLTYLVLTALVAGIWWRVWKPVEGHDRKLRVAYFSCLAVFLVMPAIFALLMAVAAPSEPRANVAFSEMLIKVTMAAMGAAVAVAVALPYGPWAGPRSARAPKPAGHESDHVSVTGD